MVRCNREPRSGVGESAEELLAGLDGAFMCHLNADPQTRWTNQYISSLFVWDGCGSPGNERRRWRLANPFDCAAFERHPRFNQKAYVVICVPESSYPTAVVLERRVDRRHDRSASDEPRIASSRGFR